MSQKNDLSSYIEMNSPDILLISRPTFSQFLSLKNLSPDLLELNVIYRSPDLEATKLWKGWSGYAQEEWEGDHWPGFCHPLALCIHFIWNILHDLGRDRDDLGQNSLSYNCAARSVHGWISLPKLQKEEEEDLFFETWAQISSKVVA